MMRKFAVLSDIHGNSWALKAVLNDIESRNIDTVFNLGDILYGPLDPKGTYDLLRTRQFINIRGNQDRFILENIGKKGVHQTLDYVLKQLDDEALNFLKNLPFDYRFGSEIYTCHGTPEKDDEYLIEHLTETHVGIKENATLNSILNQIEERIVFCGHSHQPGFIITDLKTIINPGSVGLPAYDDDLPIFHKMLNFSNHARYCIVTVEIGEVIKVEQISIKYDSESAATMAEKNNRPDWALWLRTGRA
ncbi:MAG: metallophosphoesterase family protein [Chloroflexia bacterium]|nr:metallophosphoesterase family protein [Chloroflexia bacterium]